MFLTAILNPSSHISQWNKTLDADLGETADLLLAYKSQSVHHNHIEPKINTKHYIRSACVSHWLCIIYMIVTGRALLL